MTKNLFVATDKALVHFQKAKGQWKAKRDFFLGMPVSSVFFDDRNQCLWAVLAHRHWGVKLHRSFDMGHNWEAIVTPKYPQNARLKSGKSAVLKAVWIIQSGGRDKPQRLFLGTEPGGLFISEDGGNTFEIMTDLWNHPTRLDDWFGAGRDEPYIHSIEIDPNNNEHYYIAVSCAGVFETDDDGKSWAVRNTGLKADFLPQPDAPIGHDPHRMLICQSSPNVIWQQNHCGIFRSIDSGKSWYEISEKSKDTYYGFALAIDHNNPDRAWVIPATSDTMRMAINKRLFVSYTNDGGKSWTQQDQGLPQDYAYDIVFRHSLTNRRENLAFGTTNGNLYLSENGGNAWQTLSTNLPRVNSLIFID